MHCVSDEYIWDLDDTLYPDPDLLPEVTVYLGESEICGLLDYTAIVWAQPHGDGFYIQEVDIEGVVMRSDKGGYIDVSFFSAKQVSLWRDEATSAIREDAAKLVQRDYD